MAILLALTLLSTGAVFAVENGFEAKASDKNPTFTVDGMGVMDGQMVVNENLAPPGRVKYFYTIRVIFEQPI